MAIKHSDRETKASIEYIYKYGDDLYEHKDNRQFILDDEDDNIKQSKIIVGNFIEFMMHTNLMDPNFLKVMVGMGKNYYKKMVVDENDVEDEESDKKEKPKQTKEEKESVIQKSLQSEEAFKDFVKSFNKSEDGTDTFQRRVFEIFIRAVVE